MVLHVPVIDRFRGDHFFLSNHFPVRVRYQGRQFSTSEHACMAAKTRDVDFIDKISRAENPVQAKEIAGEAPIIPDWGSERFRVMEDVIAAKFAQNPELSAKLLATRGAILVEGNTWHDQTWGSCSCDDHAAEPGQNSLGVILMCTRMRLAA